ncbi:MAG: ArsR family transcriptional regulator [Nitrosopumilaceae archaeon]|nr:ArsR family transcriptional regulator [Nitrosopumilaceae archaeon]
MGRGYKAYELKQKLIEILEDSKMGLSGIEISKKLNVNRLTMTKYLKVLAAEGFLHQKNIGNTTLWILESGHETFSFPDDYFKVAPEYLEHLINRDEHKLFSLIKNCLHSGANVSKLVIEVILPAVKEIQTLYDGGKIGNSEAKLLGNLVSNSLQIFKQLPGESDPKRKAVVISGDPESTLVSEAASATLHSKEWIVFHLGDMSSSINVLFDLDFQKLINKIGKQKSGILITIVFANSKQRLTFFSDSISPIKEKIGKRMKLVLCGPIDKKSKLDCDLQTESFEDAIQWSQNVYENSK